ncbi:hypothetical protein BC834DRAFT_465974 [Gloeopeniophorella convolvens]|nr:hypothetical protein BC834DRAFT_465974 [Gloeopeniophorella convolvens]
MRGLPFPQDAAFERETSYEYGTPASNLDDIPIDPALADPPIDPALQDHSPRPPLDQAGFPPPLSANPSHNLRGYSQGPQGDPFAQPPPPDYFPPVSEFVPTTKPAKKRKKVRRDLLCSFCEGNDRRNKLGEVEAMVSCEECGRSGHPTCMSLGSVADLIRSYPWKCIECKTCEVCESGGDDARILFCDTCDRGWHMDCLIVPLQDPPPGKWHCPSCTHNPSGVCEAVPQTPVKESFPIHTERIRGSSIASSSRSEATRPQPTKKGKRRAVTPSVSEHTVDIPDSPALPRSRTRTLTRKAMEQLSPVKRPQLKITPPRPPESPQRRMVVRLRLPSHGKGKEKEESSDEEIPKGMFDDILTPEDRDTSKTAILQVDKTRFERSRQAAELKLNPPQPKPIPQTPETPIAGPSSRPLRSTFAQPATPTPTLARSVSPTPSTPGPSPAAVHPAGLRIRTIRFGEFDVQTWYDAPFPEEYANIPDGRLWICEFCLKYNKSRFGASRHGLKCKSRHPPGDEIYRDGNVSIFEVDGRRNKIYCQNLCLLSKMFLDHKSLFYDVEPFLFYVMTEFDDTGARFVGYFSKEKRSPKDFNVSCIMTLPVRQRQGWGNLLIEFSYLLSKKERRLGSPEKPLSGLGALGYKNYWTLSIMRYLHTASDNPTLEDISSATSMTIEDVYNTLCTQGLIDVYALPTPRPLPGQSIKLTKNRKTAVARRHLIRAQTNDDDASKGPFVAPTQYDIKWDPGYVTAFLDKWESKGYLKIKPEKLKWSPFLLARVKKSDADSRLALDAESAGTPDKDNPAPGSASSVPETPAPVTPIDVDGSNDGTVSTAAHSPEKRMHSPEQPTLRRLRSQGRMVNDGANSASSFTPSRYLRGPGVSGSPPKMIPAPSRASSISVSSPKPQRTPGSSKPRGRLGASPVKRPNPSLAKEDQPPAPVQERVDEDADAALAARLAEEESRPKRLLRSRSGTGTAPAFELPLFPSRPAPTSLRPSPRKRRRVESPVADDPPLSPEPLRESGVLSGVTRSDEDARSELDESSTPFTAVTSRHSAPSDDTVVVVIVPGPNAAGSIKADVSSPVVDPHAMDVDEAPDVAAVVGTDMVADASVDASIGAEAETDADADADADADGETDADAEGEDDDDLDAEGEPDDGL